jgi:hypothetical protein
VAFSSLDLAYCDSLDLTHCDSLEQMPNSVSQLTALTGLHLLGSLLQQLPTRYANMHH